MDEKKQTEEKEVHENNHEEKHQNWKEKEHQKFKEFEEKIDKLTKDLEIANKTIDEQKSTINNYLSTASYYKNELDSQKKDFERYKERNKNIESEASTKANETIAKKILPIIDNFDQAIAHVDAEVMKGFAMIYGSLNNILTDLGVVEIKSENEKLNPELHNCISTEQTDDAEKEDTIANIYQKGYMFAQTNKVIRPATVSVYKVDK